MHGVIPPFPQICLHGVVLSEDTGTTLPLLFSTVPRDLPTF